MKIGALLLVGLTACTAARSSPFPVPTTRLGSAEEAVREAAREGARMDPRAARQLRLAEGKVARARDLIRQGEYSEAESLLQRAEADADLAEALAREAQVRSDVEVVGTQVASSARSR